MIEICMASNEKWAPLVAVTIASIMENTNSQVNVYVLETDICDKSKEKINSLKVKYPLCNIEFIKVDTDKWLKSFAPNVDYISLDSFSRFVFPYLKPKVEKIIYTDVDVVFDKDIKDLYKINLEGNVIGAVPALYYDHISGIDNERLGLDENHKYFQSGLLIMDCEKWRNQNILNKLAEEAVAKKEILKYGDQDLLNIVFENEYKYIGYEWCFITGQSYLFKDLNIGPKNLKEPAIFHYCGSDKPWLTDCMYNSKFWYYASKTPFYDTLKEIFSENKKNKPKKKKFTTSEDKFLEKIFSVKNKSGYKIITLLGLKLAIERNRKSKKISYNYRKKYVCIPVFMTIPENIFPMGFVAIKSVLENTKEFVRFYIMESDKLKISDKNRKNLDNLQKKFKNFSYEIITIDFSKFENFYTPINSHLSTETYFRYYIPILDKSVNKAIYLDYDIICLSDIKELYDIDLKGNMLAAVRNDKGEISDQLRDNLIRLGLKDIHAYFNSGVIVLDCKKLRENNILEKLIDLTNKESHRFLLADQDAFNVIFEDSNLEIPEEFNTYHFRINKEKLPKIIHYIGSEKPWLKPCVNYEYFWEYAKKTPYYKYLKKIFMNLPKVENTFLEQIFSAKNLKDYKVITIFGFNFFILRKMKKTNI